MRDWADIFRMAEAGGTATPDFLAWLRELVEAVTRAEALEAHLIAEAVILEDWND